MPGATLPPDQNATLNRLAARVETLERRTRTTDTTTRMLASLFSYPGFLIAGVESPRWYPERDVVLSQTRASVTSPFGAVVVMVRKNGADLFDVTVPTAADTALDFTVFSLNPNDYLTLRIDNNGSGGFDLSVGFVPSFGTT